MREKIKDEGRLQHIQSAINQLIEYKDKYEFCEVRDNPIVFYGFVKLVEIIGEAVYMLTKEFRESHSEGLRKRRQTGKLKQGCCFAAAAPQVFSPCGRISPRGAFLFFRTCAI